MALTINSAQYNSGAEYETVTGEIVTIDNAKPYVRMKQVVCDINPVQSGSGDPSPTNVRPISGWSEAKVARTGKNLLGGYTLAQRIQEVNPSATIDTDAKTVSYNASDISNKLIFDKFKPNTQYTFFLSSASTYSNLAVNYTDGVRSSIPLNTPYVSDNAKSIAYLSGQWISGSTVLKYEECGIFEGVLTATEFAPYLGTTYTISLGDTRYGAVLDVRRGKLRVTHGMVTYNGQEAWTGAGNSEGCYTQVNYLIKLSDYSDKIICDRLKTFPTNLNQSYRNAESGITGYTDMSGSYPNQNWFYAKTVGVTTAAEFKAWLADNPLTVVYELATPIEVDLTPTEITTLLGVNNLWSDTGDVEVEYCCSTKLFIEKKLAELMA